MDFCRNCGEEMEEGSQFCTDCGTPVSSREPVEGLAKGEWGRWLTQARDAGLGMVKAPETSISALVREPLLQASFFLALALALVQGLLVMLLVKNVADALSPLMLIPGYGPAGIGSPLYGEVFGGSFGLALLVMAGLCLGVLLAGKYLLKGQVSALAAWNLAVGTMVPVQLGLLAGVLVSFLHMGLGISIIILSWTAAIACTYVGIRKCAEVDGDKIVLSLPLVYLVMMLVVYLGIRIVS